jgi:hypothetical protein
MSTRERRPEETLNNNPGDQPTNPVRERVDSLRSHAGDLLATARTVINQALSGESENYLNTVRQRGGQ